MKPIVKTCCFKHDTKTGSIIIGWEINVSNISKLIWEIWLLLIQNLGACSCPSPWSSLWWRSPSWLPGTTSTPHSSTGSWTSERREKVSNKVSKYAGWSKGVCKFSAAAAATHVLLLEGVGSKLEGRKEKKWENSSLAPKETKKAIFVLGSRRQYEKCFFGWWG